MNKHLDFNEIEEIEIRCRQIRSAFISDLITKTINNLRLKIVSIALPKGFTVQRGVGEVASAS